MTDSYLSPIQRIIDDLSGNQAEISKISKRWRTLADNITTETGAIKRAVNTVNNAWNGTAAESFATYMARYPASGTELSTALTTCAGKLDAAGTALETAKGQVEELYREKRAWLDEQRNDPDVTTISMTSIRSQVSDALERAKAPTNQATQALKEATDEIGKHLGEARFFTAIPAPGDQDFVPGNNPAMRWVPDPDFKPHASKTQLASYNGNGSPTGGNGYAPNGSGVGVGVGGGGGGGGGGGAPSLAVPPNAHSLAPNPRAQAVIDYALKQIGDPYVWGATGPNSFDCSGLTLRAYESAGTTIPRVAHDQWMSGPRIPDGNAQPGDLVFFDNNGDGTADHVGIVLDPKEGTMIHAPRTGSDVKIGAYGGTPMGFTRPGVR
ncbi:bifunctional WXG100 family type VII secretion target/C40 family peptidase [Nonomuraea sp. H19]|uniref:bifunctional WXG100 family type VII secretion target/C40 family peptidase n=1 Tax=Nonomuraea sp. H19 TaxID=3452206 RepID=UPI003F8BBB2C